jgi:hypothetical protein
MEGESNSYSLEGKAFKMFDANKGKNKNGCCPSFVEK